MSRSLREHYAGVPTLVLGGSGFIGQWVARELAAAGAELTVAARDPDAAKSLLAARGVTARVTDGAVRREADVHDLLSHTAPEIVFNLIGYGVDRAERDDGEMLLVNRDVVRWLAAAMASAPSSGRTGQRLVHAGSALEYGDVGGNLDEGTTGQPTDQYGRSKLAGTAAITAIASASGLRAMTARLFTVYGDGEHPGRLLPTLLRAIQSSDEVALSAGSQRRDFTWVGDVAEGLLRLGASDAPPGAVINVATGTISTVRQFAEIAAGVLGIAATRLRFGVLPARPEEMRHERVATERLRLVTRWVPSTSIAEGVRRTREAAISEWTSRSQFGANA